MKNENGSTLLLVLLFIVILSLLTLMLGSMAMNARLQINKQEKNNKATDLAEMGVTYYHSQIRKRVVQSNEAARLETIEFYKKNNKATKEEIEETYNQAFCNALTSGEQTNPLKSGYAETYQIEEDYRYIVKLIQFGGSCISDNQLSVEFTSEGKASGLMRNLNVVLTISKDRIDGGGGGAPVIEVPKKDDFHTIVEEPVDIKGEGSSKIKTATASAYFENDIRIRGNRELKILGDALFRETVHLDGSSSLTIYGNAFFYHEIEGIKNPNDICIKGMAYLVQPDDSLKIYIVENNRCSPPASGDLSIPVEWSADTIPIKVDY